MSQYIFTHRMFIATLTNRRKTQCNKPEKLESSCLNKRSNTREYGPAAFSCNSLWCWCEKFWGYKKRKSRNRSGCSDIGNGDVSETKLAFQKHVLNSGTDVSAKKATFSRLQKVDRTVGIVSLIYQKYEE